MGDRVALVTGANAGIGLAIAERLAADGYRLAFASRTRDEAASDAFARIRPRDSHVWLAADLAEPAAPGRLVREAVDAFGRLDVVVNNAGVTHAKAALEVTAEDVDAVVSVDLKAPLLIAVAAAKLMRTGGAIVNVTSVHEYVPRPGFVVYAATKAALGMITRGLALEFAPLGVRVNAVAPGVIATERNDEADSLGKATPLGRAGEPSDVAAAVAFLAGDDARYVTGTSFVVDGGLLLQTVTAPAGS